MTWLLIGIAREKFDICVAPNIPSRDQMSKNNTQHSNICSIWGSIMLFNSEKMDLNEMLGASSMLHPWCFFFHRHEICLNDWYIKLCVMSHYAVIIMITVFCVVFLCIAMSHSATIL